MSIEQKVEIALKRLDSAIKLYDPIEVFGLYSGGHDSFSACFVASQHPRFSGVVHINTGIGVDATRCHVKETCQSRCWKLLEYKATENTFADGTPDPKDYDKWVLTHGFPGPGQHSVQYINLKQRCLDRLERDFNASGRKSKPRRILYVTGARQQESVRRMGNVNLDTDCRGRSVWTNPIRDWTKLDTSEAIECAKGKRNPVVDLIHKSGECLCGAFAKEGELEELNLWDITRPAYMRIHQLQNQAKEAGFPWGWGQRPPAEYMEEKRGQTFIPQMKQYLCWSCNNNHARPTANPPSPKEDK